MTMTRPASVLALLALLLATLTARATVLRPGAQTLALGNGVALAAPPSARPTLAGARADYGRLPLSFEPNRGQVSNRQVRYLAHGAGYSLYLTDRNAIIALRGSAHRSVVTLQFQHTAGAPRFQTSSPLPGRVNYFLGNNPKAWHTNIPTYARVSEQQLYAGVSAVYYGHAGRLEYDLVLQPGAHLPADALRIGGAGKLHLDRAGNLLLGESVRLNAPSIYQLVGGIRRAVDGKYQLTGHNQLGFRLGQYDHRYPVVIDPVLVYSTYLGGSNSEFATAIAVDGSGDAYLAGYTASSDFPTCPTKQPSQTDACASNSGTTLQTTNKAGTNGTAFVAKLNSAGSALIYSTYLGGGGGDVATAIAVDGSGDAYVAGFTHSTDFPTCPTRQPAQTDACDPSNTTTTLQTTLTGGQNAFVAKLNPTGSALLYSTYLGGSSVAAAYAIAVDSSGDAYVAGATNSPDFPTCPTKQPSQTDACASSGGNTLQTTNKGNNALVAKLNSTGSALLYSTYLGGSGSGGDFAQAIAVDSSGDAYVAGYTASSDFPTCPTKQPSQTDACASNSGTTLQTTLTGGQNAFVAKLNPTGSALLYSTYLGGSQIDQANAIAVDGSGNAYVAGFTSSTDFPTCPTKQPSQTDACASSSGTTLQTTNKAGTNRTPFVTELNSAGSALIYSTYLGGSSGGFGNEAYAIAVDSSGDAYVAGDTTSTDFPTCPTRQPNQTDACDAGNTTTTLQTTNKTNNGNVTAFVAKLSPASGVTAARVSRFTVSHHGRTLLFRWRMALQSGVLGFDLFAGQHRLNAHTIPAHRAAAYRFSTGRRGDAPFTLHVLLAGGGQVTLSI